MSMGSGFPVLRLFFNSTTFDRMFLCPASIPRKGRYDFDFHGALIDRDDSQKLAAIQIRSLDPPEDILLGGLDEHYMTIRQCVLHIRAGDLPFFASVLRHASSKCTDIPGR